MILIDILDAIVRYRIDNDGDRHLGKIQIELGLEFSIGNIRIVEYEYTYRSNCQLYFKSLKYEVSSVK